MSARVVEGDPKATFSIASTPRFRGRRHSFPWICPPYSWSMPSKAKVKLHQTSFFWVFCMTRPAIEPRYPGPLVNTVHIGQWASMITNKIIYYYTTYLTQFHTKQGQAWWYWNINYIPYRREETIFKKGCPTYETKLRVGVFFQCYYSQITSEPE